MAVGTVDCDSERIWKIVETQRLHVSKKKRSPTSSLTLFDRLYDCYVDCVHNANDKSFDKRFRNAVNLLQQISADEVPISLVVSLYSDEKGYSLSLTPDEQRKDIFLLYEDNEIFSYLDNQEIPPVLMEVLSKTKYCHTFSGCVVCEVRDYRHPSPPASYDSHLLLLRPTTETVLQMVNEITAENNCSLEDQLLLESKLLLATQPPICLEPSTEVACVTNRLHYNRRKFHSPSMRRYLRRRSQARRARMGVASQSPAPPELCLHDYLAGLDTPLLCPRTEFCNLWRRREVDLTAPNPDMISRSVFSHAKQLKEVTPVTTPTAPEPPHSPGQTTPPVPLSRTLSQRLVDELLQPSNLAQGAPAVNETRAQEKGRRPLPLPLKSPPPPLVTRPLSLPSTAPPPPQSSPVIVSGPAPPTHTSVLTSPPPSTIPTITQAPPSQPSPSLPSLTHSIPLASLPSYSRLPSSRPPSSHSPSQPPSSHPPPSHPPPSHLPLSHPPSPHPPCSLPYLSTSFPSSFLKMYHQAMGGGGGGPKKPRSIAPALHFPSSSSSSPTTSSSSPMFVIAPKSLPGSVGMASTGNVGVANTSLQVGKTVQDVPKRLVGMPAPPQLQRPPQLHPHPPPSNPPQLVPTSMPKLHRLPTTFPTPHLPPSSHPLLPMPKLTWMGPVNEMPCPVPTGPLPPMPKLTYMCPPEEMLPFSLPPGPLPPMPKLRWMGPPDQRPLPIPTGSLPPMPKLRWMDPPDQAPLAVLMVLATTHAQGTPDGPKEQLGRPSPVHPHHLKMNKS